MFFLFVFSRSLPVCPSMLMWRHSSSSSPCLLRFSDASNFTFDLVFDIDYKEVLFYFPLPMGALERLPLNMFESYIRIITSKKRESIFLELTDMTTRFFGKSV